MKKQLTIKHLVLDRNILQEEVDHCGIVLVSNAYGPSNEVHGEFISVNRTKQDNSEQVMLKMFKDCGNGNTGYTEVLFDSPAGFELFMFGEMVRQLQMEDWDVLSMFRGMIWYKLN
jgi:hypothetical protein